MHSLLKVNFEYRVEISYLLFFLALTTLVLPYELLYRKVALLTGMPDGAAMSALFWAIAAVNFLAGVLRVRACAYIGSSVMMKKEVQARKVVAAGPYAYVRNPIYLADIMSMTATAFAGNFLSLIVLFFGKLLTTLLFCIYEESNLLEYIGADYKDYYDRVPRFIPKFYPYHRASVEIRPDYYDGLLHSFYPFGICAGFVFASITGVYYHVFIVGAIAPAFWYVLYLFRK